MVTGEDGRATFTADLPNDLTPEYGVMPIEKIEDEDIDPGFSQTVIEDVRLIGDTNSLFYATETKALQVMRVVRKCVIILIQSIRIKTMQS